MQDFVHLHVHTQYSLLDGQASVSRLVDKAMKDGMRGIAVTDHGNMFGIKEFTNYVNKKNGGPKGEIKDLKKKMADIESGKEECEDKEAALADCREKIAAAEARIFKPIIGCEMYVARRTMDKKEGKPDQSGYHLVVLAKNEKGYHNLIKLVSHAWTQGYYMRPRTDRNELEKYHEGLIVCSACLGGEIPKKITNDLYEEAEEAIRWYKNLFGDDFYLELQRHKATVPRANHEAYPMQQKVNAKLLEYSKKFGIKLICTNDVHFVDEENAEAHDRLICLSTGKDLDDPTRMLYTKQEWMKTKAEMNELLPMCLKPWQIRLRFSIKWSSIPLTMRPSCLPLPSPKTSVRRRNTARNIPNRTCSTSSPAMRTAKWCLTRKLPTPRSSVWEAMRSCIVSSWRPTTWPNWHSMVPNVFMAIR